MFHVIQIVCPLSSAEKDLEGEKGMDDLGGEERDCDS